MTDMRSQSTFNHKQIEILVLVSTLHTKISLQITRHLWTEIILKRVYKVSVCTAQ